MVVSRFARGFIHEHESGAVHQRASDGYTLLLASRELTRTVVQPLSQPKRLQQLLSARTCLSHVVPQQ